MPQLEREQFNFSQEFQDLILACTLKKPEFSKYASVISHKYFSGSVSTTVACAIFSHHKRTATYPAKETLIQLARDAGRRVNDTGDEEVEYVEKLFKIKTHDWPYVHERVIAFCRERELLGALTTSVAHFKEGTQPDGGYVKLFETAMATGTEFTDLDLLKFDPLAKYDRPEPVLVLGAHALLTPGNLGVVAGLPKVGKSAALSAILGALISKPGGVTRDLLGFSGHNPDRKGVLHLDTEQSRFDHAALARLALGRAGLKKAGCLHSYAVTGLDLKGRLGALRSRAREIAEVQGLLAVVIDGVGDLCADPNDPKESFALVDELHRLAARYECLVVCVLHENPASANGTPGKTRGHLGSQLQRKAECNLRLRKDADGVTVMFGRENRHCDIPESCGPCFRWNDEVGMHVSCASTRVRKADIQTQALRELAAAVFLPTQDGPARLRHKELVERIIARENCSESTAKGRIVALANEKLVKKLEDGAYLADENL